MNVQQLILRLQEYDPKAMVVVDGYEGGVEELRNLHEVTIIFNVHTEGYYGPHEMDRENPGPNAIYLPR